jgi:hypothetical protein
VTIFLFGPPKLTCSAFSDPRPSTHTSMSTTTATTTPSRAAPSRQSNLSAPPTPTTSAAALPKPLSIHGKEEVQKAIAAHKKTPPSLAGTMDEPDQISGYLHKENRVGSRYFETIPGTPLLVYYRTRTLATAASYPPHAAIDLSAATKIALVTSNGQPTTRFVIQSQSAADANSVEHVQLKAGSLNEAKNWVATLSARNKYFTRSYRNTQLRSKPASRLDLVNHAKVLMNSVDDITSSSEDVTAATAARMSTLSVKGLSKFKSSAMDPDAFFSAPSDDDYEEDGLANSGPPVLPATMWDEPSYETVPLRGYNYLNDHVKVKASRSLLKLIAVDCFYTRKRVDHLSALPNSRTSKLSRTHFTWCLVIQVPGSQFYYFCLYFCALSEVAQKLLSPSLVNDAQARQLATKEGYPPHYVSLLRSFFFGDSDEFRNERFKMVPQILDGPWIVRNAVPNKPALIGKKVTHRYFRSTLGAGYMELDMDVSSSSIANRLTQLAIGYASSLVCDLGFTLEGRSSEELPEEILGTARANHTDLVGTAVPLPGVLQ